MTEEQKNYNRINGELLNHFKKGKRDGMKIIATPDKTDKNMILLYTGTGKAKFLMAAIHVDCFDGEIYRCLQDGDTLTLNLSFDGEF